MKPWVPNDGRRGSAKEDWAFFTRDGERREMGRKPDGTLQRSPATLTLTPLHHRGARAMTMVEVLAVMFVLLLLAALAFPVFAKRNKRSERIVCISNLKQAGLAFRMWANDHNGKFPWQVPTVQTGTLEFVSAGSVLPHFLAISNELTNPKVLACPKDSSRTPVSSWSQFTKSKHLSYLVGLDADENRPQSILSGDRNLVGATPLVNRILTVTSNDVVKWTGEIHNSAGNLALGDGSAHQLTDSLLNKQFQAAILSGQPAQRLAIPE